MKPKIIIPTILIMLIIVVLVTNLSIKEKHINLEAKVDSYETISELELDSNIIVSGSKVSEDQPTILKDEQENILALYTLSKYKIETIEKNNALNPVSPGDIITILENEATIKEQHTTYHIANYQKMKTGNHYLLFLRYAEDNEWYVPAGVTIGKIPLIDSENLIYSEDKDDFAYAETIAAKIKKKYRKFWNK